jgi:hypothetical protein
MNSDQTPGKEYTCLKSTDHATLTKVNFVLNTFNSLLHQIFDDYKKGNIDEISSFSKIMLMEKASATLHSTSKSTSPLIMEARKMANIVQGLVTGMQQTIQINNKLITSLQRVEQAESAQNDMETIMSDKDLLTQYLIEKQSRTTFIPDQVVTAMSAKLRPEYEIYVLLHDFPQNGVFDSIKLNTIRYEIQLGKYDGFFASQSTKLPEKTFT